MSAIDWTLLDVSVNECHSSFNYQNMHQFVAWIVVVAVTHVMLCATCVRTKHPNFAWIIALRPTILFNPLPIRFHSNIAIEFILFIIRLRMVCTTNMVGKCNRVYINQNLLPSIYEKNAVFRNRIICSNSAEYAPPHAWIYMLVRILLACTPIHWKNMKGAHK